MKFCTFLFSDFHYFQHFNKIAHFLTIGNEILLLEQALKALTPLDTTEDEAPIIGTPTKRGRPRTKNKDTPKKGN